MKPRATSVNRTRLAGGTKATLEIGFEVRSGSQADLQRPLQPSPLQPWKGSIPTFVVQVGLLDDLFSAAVEPARRDFSDTSGRFCIVMR